MGNVFKYRITLTEGFFDAFAHWERIFAETEAFFANRRTVDAANDDNNAFIFAGIPNARNCK